MVMNILDVSNAYNSLQTNPDTNMTPRVEMPVRLEQPVVPQDGYIRQTGVNPENANIPPYGVKPPRQERQVERRDEYIRSMNTIYNALYSVSDISQDRYIINSNRIQENRYYPDGKRVTKKIIDIILSMGIKKLSIFLMEA